MTPAARYAAAIGVLDRWREGVPAERALTAWARGSRFAGSKDRAAVRDHVYDVLRRKGSCAALGGADSGRGLILGLLRLTGVAPETVFTGEGYAPAPLTPEEQDAPDAMPDPMADTPDWLLAPLAAQYGDALAPLLAEMVARAPVYLRVNPRKATRDAAREALAEDGVTAEPVPGCETALRVTGGARALRQSRAYLDGLVELQDLSVQRACELIDWPGTGRILDYCAGAGGKALAIAAATDAAVFVHDANPQRMADLPARAGRAGVALTAVDAAAVGRTAPYDLVLCDVPCSGSGTWRRDPEAKWALSAAKLAALTRTQDTILDQAAALVARGGRLVYMTCSLLRAENEDRIAAFLARSPGWRRGVTASDTPLTASDGFFVAELTQTGARP